jgi:tetratricopeptide (TPR) repeat protein
MGCKQETMHGSGAFKFQLLAWRRKPMKVFKYVSLISASLLLAGGLFAGQANAQSRTLSTVNGQTGTQANGQANGQAAPAANGNGAAAAPAGRRLATQGETTNFSTLGITPETYIRRILSVQDGQATPAQAAPTQAAPAQAIPAPAAAQPGESEYDRLMRLGYAESRVGNYALAQQYFEQALAVNPGDRMATIAYWNMENAIQKTAQAAQAAQTTQASLRIARVSNAADPVTAVTPDFDRYMSAGYTATEARDYQTALQYFNAALQLRPNNPYALQAIRNVNTYIQASQ